MKYDKFFKTAKSIMLYRTNIDMYTLNTFISLFRECMSNKERTYYAIDFDLILGNTTKQITLDNIVEREKTKNLENRLQKLKEGNEIAELKDLIQINTNGCNYNDKQITELKSVLMEYILPCVERAVNEMEFNDIQIECIKEAKQKLGKCTII